MTPSTAACLVNTPLTPDMGLSPTSSELTSTSPSTPTSFFLGFGTPDIHKLTAMNNVICRLDNQQSNGQPMMAMGS